MPLKVDMDCFYGMILSFPDLDPFTVLDAKKHFEQRITFVFHRNDKWVRNEIRMSTPLQNKNIKEYTGKYNAMLNIKNSNQVLIFKISF